MLCKHGLCITQTLDYEDGVDLLVTRLHHVSGEQVSGKQRLLLDKQSPQGQGSAITYAKRYGWLAILGLAAVEDDDDAEQAEKAAPAKPSKATAPPRKGGGKGQCPECGVEAVIKGRPEHGGGWVCWKKADGCGKKWTYDPIKKSGSMSVVEELLDMVKPMLHEGETPPERLKEIAEMNEIPLGATLKQTSAENLEKLQQACRDELATLAEREQ